MRRFFFGIHLVAFLCCAVQYSDAQVIFELGDEQVDIAEFKYVYEKNNGKEENIYSRESVEEYLDLYVNFKLKVKEAEAMGLDTTKAFVRELAGYREQLAQTYMNDKQVTEDLLKEAYNRSQRDVKASHILIRLPEDPNPRDRRIKLDRIAEIRQEILDGLDFNAAAEKYSEDPSAKDNKGDLGYVSVFKTVYDFESAIYDMKVGEISQAVETKFGYHLIKVEGERPAKGEVRVAHLFLKKPKFSDVQQQKLINQKIQTLHKELLNGANFRDLVTQHSEDKTSISSGGDLSWFGTGKMLESFENAAFALKEKGDFSEPVETQYGWHIIQLLDKRPLGTFDQMRSRLKSKVEKDSRSQVAKSTFIKNLKKEYKFKKYNDAVDHVFAQVDEKKIQNGRWKLADELVPNTSMFRIAGKDYNSLDFAAHLEKNQRKFRSKKKDQILKRAFGSYIEQELMKEEDKHLEAKYPEFASLMNEYHDGMLLFELTNREVWDKAVKDTVGLEAYYDVHKEKYKWEKRALARKVNLANNELAAKVQKAIGKPAMNETLLFKKFNRKSELLSGYSEKPYEKGQDEYIDSVDWNVGEQKLMQNDDGSFTQVHILRVLEESVKSLDDCRGYVISDYQNELEKEWVKDLKSKYPITLNQEVVDTLFQ